MGSRDRRVPPSARRARARESETRFAQFCRRSGHLFGTKSGPLGKPLDNPVANLLLSTVGGSTPAKIVPAGPPSRQVFFPSLGNF